MTFLLIGLSLFIGAIFTAFIFAIMRVSKIKEYCACGNEIDDNDNYCSECGKKFHVAKGRYNWFGYGDDEK